MVSQLTAPPFLPALLYVNMESLIVLLIPLAALPPFMIVTAPPYISALFLVNVQLIIVSLEFDIATAPPSPLVLIALLSSK